jgi:hypothetical protein
MSELRQKLRSGDAVDRMVALHLHLRAKVEEGLDAAGAWLAFRLLLSHISVTMFRRVACSTITSTL